MRLRSTALLVVLLLTAATACGAEEGVRQPNPQPLPMASDPTQCDHDSAYDARPVAEEPAGAEALLTVAGTSVRNLVSTPDPQATAAACRVLAGGGTAADALVAAQYVLGLTEPQYSGPGGGGLALYYDAPSGIFEAYDGTVHAPDGEAAEVDPDGGPAVSVGVPQTDRLMATLADRFGTQSLTQLTAPARALAQNGFVVSARLAEAMAARPEVFGRDGLPRAGERLTNPEYADYLSRLAAGEPLGDVDRQILAAAGVDPAAGGQLAALAADWSAQRTTPVPAAEPLCVPYQDHRLCGSPSTATGFMVVAQSLGILDSLDLARLTPRVSAGPGRPVARATAVHLVQEAQRLAFTDANTWMNDPDADPELSRAYLERIVTDRSALAAAAGRIRQQRSLTSPEPVELDGRPHRYSDSADQGTSQIAVRDSAGSLASLTTTLQRSFGSGIKVHGFYLNNSLDNFTAAAAVGEPNRRAPGQRPRTMMAPVVVLDESGAPVLAAGSPGGRKIPSYVVKVIVAVLDWGFSPLQAVQMPNFGATNRNAVYLEKVRTGGSADDMKEISRLLRKWGHDGLDVGRYDSGLSVIRVDGGRAAAAADFRRHGLTLGVDAG